MATCMQIFCPNLPPYIIIIMPDILCLSSLSEYSSAREKLFLSIYDLCRYDKNTTVFRYIQYTCKWFIGFYFLFPCTLDWTFALEEIYPLKQCFQTVFHLTEQSVTRLRGIDIVIANDILMLREYLLLFVGLLKRGCWMPSCPPSNWIWRNCPKSCSGLKTRWSANKPTTQLHQSFEFWTYVDCWVPRMWNAQFLSRVIFESP